jgi:hypothetical protein
LGSLRGADRTGRLETVGRERELLHDFYAKLFPRKPAFHLTIDASVFALEDIAQHLAWQLGGTRPVSGLAADRSA